MTDNFQIYKQWSLVVPAAKETFLISWNNTRNVEFYMTDDTTKPADTLEGHILKTGEALTRNTIGTGNLWARIHKAEETDYFNLIIS